MEAQETPKISVIMSIYNQWNREQLDAAVMSVLNQTFGDFEFIIYDDGSEQEVHTYLERYAEMDSRVVLISNPVNHGLAYSLNTCIDVAKGKYLARMDADDVCAPNRFEVQYNYLENHTEIAFVGCNAKLIDDKGVWGSRKMVENPGRHAFLRFSPFIHPTVMIRSKIFADTDAYKVSKGTWRCEDYELFMRLWKLGHRGYNIQQELFYYREDRSAYKKRKMKYRIDEMKLRYRNFSELGMLNAWGWLYVIKPVVAGCVPNFLILFVKRVYHKWKLRNEERLEQKTGAVSEELEQGTDVAQRI